MSEEMLQAVRLIPFLAKSKVAQDAVFTCISRLYQDKAEKMERKSEAKPVIPPDLGVADDLAFEGCNRYRKIAFLLMGKEAGSN